LGKIAEAAKILTRHLRRTKEALRAKSVKETFSLLFEESKVDTTRVAHATRTRHTRKHAGVAMAEDSAGAGDRADFEHERERDSL